MRPVCTYTDFFVICSGGNSRQTKAIYDEVAHSLKKDGRVLPRSVDGVQEGTWIVADYLDVVLHVFTPTRAASTSSRSSGRTCPRSRSPPPPDRLCALFGVSDNEAEGRDR